MTPEELAPIWAAFWESADEQAHEILVRQFLPLANYLARRALAKAPAHQDAEDIRSFAHHGLLDAITRFRPDAGASFETYATRRISGSIVDGQRAMDPLTRSARRTVKAMTAAAEELWAELGREPTHAELAERSGLEIDAVRQAIVEQQTLTSSLDWATGNDDHDDDWFDQSKRGLHTQHSEMELAAQLDELGVMISHRLAHLPGRERAFALVHYVDGATMTDTAAALDIGSDWCTRTRGNVLDAVRG